VLEPIWSLCVIRATINMQGKGWVVEQQGGVAPSSTADSASRRSLSRELAALPVAFDV
jgi:hypothetical protein